MFRVYYEKLDIIWFSTLSFWCVFFLKNLKKKLVVGIVVIIAVILFIIFHQGILWAFYDLSKPGFVPFNPIMDVMYKSMHLTVLDIV